MVKKELTRKQDINPIDEKIDDRRTFKIMCVLLFFVYGICSISAAQDRNEPATFIGLVQFVFVGIPVVSEEEIIKISDKVAKTLLYTSVCLSLPFLILRII